MGIRISSGIKGMDKLIDGGFEVGSVILLSGGPGTGKTTFCLQFLVEGAKKGEHGLFVSFEETEDDLIRDAKNYSMDLAPLVSSKKLIVLHFSPFEYDKFKEDLGFIIKKYDIKRVVIDSISGIGFYLKDVYNIRKNVWELAKIIKTKGCTALLTSEVVGEDEHSRFGVEEFISDSLIRLHFGGLGGDFDRSLQVIKMRRTNQKKGLFPYKIDKNGISITPSQA